MPDTKSPHNDLAVALIAQTPAEIHVLLIQEIPRCESSQLPEDIRPDHQTCASDPFHLDDVIPIRADPDSAIWKQTK